MDDDKEGAKTNGTGLVSEPFPVLTMKAYVINLVHRKDRWEGAQKAWSPYFELERYPAIQVQDARIGCKRSHYCLAEHAMKKEGKPVVIVLEDDARPTK